MLFSNKSFLILNTYIYIGCGKWPLPCGGCTKGGGRWPEETVTFGAWYVGREWDTVDGNEWGGNAAFGG